MSVKEIIVLIIFLSVWFISLSYIFSNYILIPYKRSIRKLPLNELLNLLQFYINNEIELYESSIFNGLTNGIYTNAQFENFYKDITTKAIDAIPDDFIKQFDGLITEEYIVSIISRQTKIYLQNKITDGISSANKENNLE